MLGKPREKHVPALIAGRSRRFREQSPLSGHAIGAEATMSAPQAKSVAVAQLNVLYANAATHRRAIVNDTGAADSAERIDDPDSGIVLAVAQVFG